ncbi:MAG: hypothetical protein IKP40_00565 [Clostridia bacterium]|nr:hypothetical protein [Clostridia bacterium]
MDNDRTQAMSCFAQLDSDPAHAADYLAERVQEACRENPGVTALEVRLDLFYAHRVTGINAQGERFLLYDFFEDHREDRGILDWAWASHCGERAYYDDFEELVRQALQARDCPPAEFIPLEGQAVELLQKRNELYDAIGDRREVSEILTAILPVWPQSNGMESLYLLQAGVDQGSDPDGMYFVLSWTWQVEDEESDQYYQLEIECRYALDDMDEQARDGLNRLVQTDWLLESLDDFAEAVRRSQAYQWALGREADRVWVTINGT